MPSNLWTLLAVGLGLAVVAGVLTPRPTAAEETAPARVERIAVGQEAPDFTLTSSDGKTYSPSTLRGEKNLLMIFFRGTW